MNEGERSGVHPTAIVSSSARLDLEVEVGPGAVIEDGAQVGEGARIGPCAYIGPNVVVGPGCLIGAGAVLLSGTTLGCHVVVSAGVVLGTDGFGYVLEEGRHRKIPQVGRVEVGDRAVLGAGTCVDRATTGATSLGADSILGTMVMIGHNCRVGDRTRIGDQSGLAGSSRLGDDCLVGAQCGMAMRAELGDRCRLADRAGALRRFPADQDLAGFPARPRREVERVEAALRRLPRVLERLDAQES